MNYKWKLEPPTPEKLEAAERLAKELNISPILGRLLIERNITTVADAKKFSVPRSQNCTTRSCLPIWTRL